MAPQRLLRIARRWLPLLILGMILPGVATYVLTSVQPQVYQVSAILLPAQLRLAGNPDFNTVAMSRLVGLATNYSYTAKSHDLLSNVGRELNLTDGVEQLSKRVDATVDANAAALTITARAGSAAAAALLANAVANAVETQSSAVQDNPSLLGDVATVRQRILETEAEYQRLLALPPPRTVENTQALNSSLSLLQNLTNVYNSLTASINSTPGGLTVVDQADAQLAQMIAPRTLYYTLLAVVAGLLIAAGIASLLEYFDDSVKDSEDLEEVADLRLLGTIAPTRAERGRAVIRPLATLVSPRSGVAEAFRMLRSSIDFASVDAPIRTLLVTSSLPGEGKTITAANLAVAFAQAGRQVLLVDADLRRPGVHLVFDVPNAHGLTTLLRSDEVGLDTITQVSEQANLRILTTGPLPPNPAELLGTKRMQTILDRLKAGGDLVIFDGPPLQAVTDSAILGSFLDGTLYVIAAGRSRRGAVRLGIEALAMAHANVLGVVMFDAPRGSVTGYHENARVSPETPVIAGRAVEPANPT